eukprot:CAMPEP_0184685046 /NCGR_PEP_ID=MMETSP0312-20130426/17468_1 /TAXON_ID=31354 /ORGANISM="Compsopogon coeruleus, Strain SAG 36.94" /LENGTH=52 /DNA_ID=CAMNT_0027138757 /DNA_START=312 /DNA_END=467 /DNA_ORIENTATION=-
MESMPGEASHRAWMTQVECWAALVDGRIVQRLLPATMVLVKHDRREPTWSNG